MKNLLKIKALLIAFLATYKISYATALPMDDYSFLYYKPPFYVTVIKTKNSPRLAEGFPFRKV